MSWTDFRWLQTHCLNATEIDLSETSLKDNPQDTESKLKSNSFRGRTALKTVWLPEETLSLGKQVFANCTKLKNIVFPEKLVKLGDGDFRGCISLPDRLVMTSVKPPLFDGNPFGEVKTLIVPGQSVSSYKNIWRDHTVIPMATVELDRKMIVLEAPESSQLTAKVTLNYGMDQTVYWASSNPSVAKVNEKGLVTAIKPGTAAITAITRSGSEAAECTIAVTGLPAPSAKAAASGYNQAKITWSGVSRANKYEIYRSSGKGSAGSKICTLSASARSYVDTGRTTGTTYYYRVRGVKTVNGVDYRGDYSLAMGVKPLPSKPSGVKARRGGSRKIKVTWKKVSGASGYTAYRSTKKTGGFKAVKTYKNGKSVKYVTGKLKKGKRYYFKVRAYRTVKKESLWKLLPGSFL